MSTLKRHATEHTLTQAMVGLGGRDRMLKHLSTKYANIPRECVDLFKSYCVPCQEPQTQAIHKMPKPKSQSFCEMPGLFSHFVKCLDFSVIL